MEKVFMAFTTMYATEQDKEKLANYLAKEYLNEVNKNDYVSLNQWVSSNFGDEPEEKKVFRDDLEWFINEFVNNLYLEKNIGLDLHNNDFGYKEIKKAMAKLFK